MFSAKPRQVSVGSGSEHKKRHLRARRKPAWDSTINDLTTLKATPEEIDRRKRVHRSQNMDLVKQEKLRKHVAKLHQQRQLASGLQSTSAPNSVLRDILYGNNHIFEALERSDRLMASVQDLLGDNTKKFQGLPYVTKAPHHSQLDRSLPEVSEVLSRLDLNSESVMDKSALNEFVNELDSSFSSSASHDLDGFADGYRPAMDIARFKRLIRESDLDYLAAESSSSDCVPTAVESAKQTSQTVAVGQRNSKETDARQQLARSKQMVASGQVEPVKRSGSDCTIGEGSDKGRMGNGGGDGGTPVMSPRMESAMNDTERVQRVRSVLNTNTQASTKLCTMEDFDEMLEIIQANLADSEARSISGSSITGAQRASTYSGYTMALLDAVAKMSVCIKQNEVRARTDKVTAEQLTAEVQHLHGLVHGLTADILAVQEEYSRVKNDFVKYKRDTEIHWLLLSQTLSTYGIQLQLPIQQQLPPASLIVNQRPVSQDASHLPGQQQSPVSSVSNLSVSRNGLEHSTEHQIAASSFEHQRLGAPPDIMHHEQIPGVMTVVQQSATKSEQPRPSGSAGATSFISALDKFLPVNQHTPLTNSAANFTTRALDPIASQLFRPSAADDGSRQSVMRSSEGLVATPVQNDQQDFEVRRELIRQRMAELNRQRNLAQSKMDELKRHQAHMSAKPKVSPSISPITVASDPSGIMFSTHISYDNQAISGTRSDINGQSTRRLDVKMPKVNDYQKTMCQTIPRRHEAHLVTGNAGNAWS